MAIPAPPVLGYSFTSHSTNDPSTPQPGASLDAEFNRTNGAVGQLITAVSVSINADGTLNSTQVGAAYTAWVAGGGGGGGGGGGTTPSAQLYAELAQAWAEYLPDQIPAATLITDGIVGQHYSAAYWANQAAVQVAIQAQKLQQALAAGQLNYGGPFPNGPVTSLVGFTVNAGALTANVLSVAGRTGAVVLTPADMATFNTTAAAAAPVQSVAGRTGAVVLTPADLATFNTTAAAAAPVQSVAGRTGAIVLTPADMATFNATASAAAPVQSVAGRTGAVVLTPADMATFNAAAAAAAVPANPFRNALLNGLFTVNQRGSASYTVAGYTLDRWNVVTGTGGGTRTISSVALSDSYRATIGDEAAQYGMQYAVVGGAAAGDFDAVTQNIENLQLYSGKTVTVSFWAWSTAGTPKFAIELVQNFGTGGSPSAAIFSIGCQAFTVSTTPALYTANIAVPSTAGKTFGTNGDSMLSLALWVSSGATNNASRASSIGVQSATIGWWGAQIALDSLAQREKRPIAAEYALCQRHFLAATVWVPPGTAPQPSQILFPVRQRAIPSVGGGGAGFSVVPSVNGAYFTQTTGAAQTLTFSADL